MPRRAQTTLVARNFGTDEEAAAYEKVRARARGAASGAADVRLVRARARAQFMEECPVEDGKMGQSQALEGIKAKAAWFNRDGVAVRAWLEEKYA